jgi:hypothetical protein
MTTPFSLSDEELDRVIAAAAMLPARQRDSFVRSVAGRVAGLPCVGMAEIESAIAFTLNVYGVTGGLAFKGRPDKAAHARQKAERSFK